ncbi:UNVERIFIED_CONTAM: hypothetical protein FKN15_041144 [Acipenser sinensis]
MCSWLISPKCVSCFFYIKVLRRQTPSGRSEIHGRPIPRYHTLKQTQLEQHLAVCSRLTHVPKRYGTPPANTQRPVRDPRPANPPLPYPETNTAGAASGCLLQTHTCAQEIYDLNSSYNDSGDSVVVENLPGLDSTDNL